jgi:hypothetical protein
MLWVICSVMAILLGIVFYAKVEPEIPQEIGFLKSKPAAHQVLEGGDAAQTNMSSIPLSGVATGWTFQTDGNVTLASKDFEQPIAGPNGQVYDKPSFAIMCYEGHLYARVNTRVRAGGDAPINFDVKGLPGWRSAPNQDWYSADAGKTIDALRARGSVGVRIAFEELGQQRFTFNANGISAIVQKMTACAR